MKDMTGQRFGRLVVIGRAATDRKQGVCWHCKCDCGNEIDVLGIYLRCGDTKSCGCLHRENVSAMMSTHGLSKTRLYRVWAGIKNRCYNPHAENYKYYGANGITMCDEWRNSFESFHDWAVNNGYDEHAAPQQCTIDRIDVTLGYSPDNCRWVDHVTQCNNQTSNKLFTYNGATHTMAEWARILQIKYATLRARIQHGVPFEEAIIM